jgi:hypothetical protein
MSNNTHPIFAALLSDVACLIGLAAFNIAVGLLLYGFAPDIAAWVAR